MRESEELKKSVYDTVVVATSKHTRRPSFFDAMQKEAARPIVLRKLIARLIHGDTSQLVPRSKKDHKMVIRVRTRDAYTRLKYLRKAD